MLILAAAGIAEMEPGDGAVLEVLYMTAIAVLVCAVAVAIAIGFFMYKAIGSLESREQRRSRTSKSLFESDDCQPQ